MNYSVNYFDKSGDYLSSKSIKKPDFDLPFSERYKDISRTKNAYLFTILRVGKNHAIIIDQGYFD